MSRKVSLYVSPPIERVLKVVDAGGENSAHSVSGRIADVCERYMTIARESLPDLSMEEWHTCLDALNGVSLQPHSAKYVIVEIHDAMRLNNLHAKWGADPEVLSEKLSSMTTANLIALLEVAEQFWADTSLEVEHLLDRIAGRVKEHERS